jgi:hypothetical protein
MERFECTMRIMGEEDAWVVEAVDTRDLKSLGACPRTGSNPVPGTNDFKELGL